ncbi:MAG: hypothetical protein SV775_17610, partial [Thermodesulfobacteriota bacterium]|nr:hypothetical protein [Thermodesulfobacteriota bacterium]
PARTVTWILRGSYIDGAPFTMGGRAVRLEEVERIADKKEAEDSGQTDEKKGSGKGGRTVIPFRKPSSKD